LAASSISTAGPPPVLRRSDFGAESDGISSRGALAHSLRVGGRRTDEFGKAACVQALTSRRSPAMRRSLVLVGALTIALGCATWARVARAEEGVHVDASLSGFTSPTFVDKSMHVGTGENEIDMLKANDVRLVGNGAFSGAALHATARFDRL